MRVTRLEVRDFRNLARAELAPAPGLTVLVGANGAGKTNLLEAIYFGCTGRSCRTAQEREVVRFGSSLARVTIDTVADDGAHRLEVGFQPGEAKALRVDGSAVESLARSSARPLVSVFLPERLELVKGGPGARRAHVDQFVAALWPGRVTTRRSYLGVLAQRNALLVRVRSGRSRAELLDQWDAELVRHGVRLAEDRAEAVALIAADFAARAEELGLPETAEVRLRLSWRDEDAAAAALRERRDDDVARGFTTRGPHRDDLELVHGGRGLRAYGSQGQQRVALLALLLAERDALVAQGRAPLLLLDDVMSELDEERRRRLAELARAGGQCVITATEPGHVPGADDADVLVVRLETGALLVDATVAP